jgi:Xaa-Pro aminopeptidase
MAPPPPPPPLPPPPPPCLPSTRKKGRNTSRRMAQHEREGSLSPTAAHASDVERLTFSSDTESYNVPSLNQVVEVKRSDSKRFWGKFGFSRNKGVEIEPEYISGRGILEWTASRSSGGSGPSPDLPLRLSSKSGRKSSDSYPGLSSRTSSKSSDKRRPLWLTNSTDTLVGSALERYMADGESIRERTDTTDRLEDLRKLMEKEKLDYL